MKLDQHAEIMKIIQEERAKLELPQINDAAMPAAGVPAVMSEEVDEPQVPGKQVQWAEGSDRRRKGVIWSDLLI